MNRKLLALGSAAAMLFAVFLFSFNTVMADPIAPSLEITGGPQPGNYCAGGTVQFPVWVNVNHGGWSDIHLYLHDANHNDWAHQSIDWARVVKNGPDTITMSFTPMQDGQPYVIQPTDDYTKILVQVWTYPTPGMGSTNYYSSMVFECATGQLLGIEKDWNGLPLPMVTPTPGRSTGQGPVLLPANGGR